MINAFSLLRRKPGMSVDSFQQHWRTEHAGLILRLPGVVRYVQSHPLPQMYEQGEPAYDGVAELWARDSQAFRDIGASDAYRAVQADEETFLDRAATALVLTEEQIIKEGPAPADGVKCICLLKRKPGMPVDEFQTRWREGHGPRFAALPSLERYAQYPARLGGYAKGREPAYDGFDISWFGSMEAFQDAMNASERASLLAPDACRRILSREFVIGGDA